MASETTVPTFDNLLHDLGDFGPYQLRTVLLLAIPATFMNAWQSFDLVFMLYSPNKTCHEWNINTIPIQDQDECELEGKTVQNVSLKLTLHCQNWTFDHHYFDNTLKTQWGLCQNQILFKNVIAIFSLLSIIGLGIMSMVQDVIGRKLTFLISLTLAVSGCGFSLLAPSLIVWVAIRAIQASQGNMTYSLPFVWAQEFVGPNKRTLVNFIVTLLFSTATVTLGLVSWACHTWIQLGMITSLPFLFLYSYYFLVDESPRWLLSVGKVDQAKKIIEKIIKKNHKESETANIMAQVDVIAKTAMTEQGREKLRFEPLQLLRYPNLRAKVILLNVIWMANALIYSSMAFNAPNLRSNMYVAYIAQASVEAPACVFNLFLSNRIGRIPPIIVSMLWSSFFCFMCLPAIIGDWNGWCLIIFSALAKFGICISYNILYQATGELYPTALRGTAVGIHVLVGGLAVGVMPYILDSSSAAKWIPMLVFGIITFIGAICSCFLPEPMDHVMPQTPVEAEKVSKVGVCQILNHVKHLVRCGR